MSQVKLNPDGTAKTKRKYTRKAKPPPVPPSSTNTKEKKLQEENAFLRSIIKALVSKYTVGIAVLVTVSYFVYSL